MKRFKVENGGYREREWKGEERKERVRAVQKTQITLQIVQILREKS